MSRIGRMFIQESMITTAVEELFLKYGERGPCKCKRPGYDRKWPNHCRTCGKPHAKVWQGWKEKGWIDYEEGS